MSKKTEAEQPSEPPDLTLVVNGVHRALTAALLRKLVERGFSDLSPAYAAILPLIELHGVRQVDVAQRAGLSKQAVGQLVQELSVRGYLELVADPRDRRARVVSFTARGLALKQAGLEIKKDLWIAATRAIGSKAAGQLTHDLRTMADALAALATDNTY